MGIYIDVLLSCINIRMCEEIYYTDCLTILTPNSCSTWLRYSGLSVLESTGNLYEGGGREGGREGRREREGKGSSG